ncbi:MAG: methyltransferase domain-containing protein [Candidatus Melainabacteria bacterium]|nr:methyltransferase domain-containing protein [Candidatus Melainabacteria bacterium]
MKVSKKEFWDERYKKGTIPWDIGQVAPAFVKYFHSGKSQLAPTTTKKIAVLGCGRGYDAFSLAKNHKFKVYGFDFSESAIKFCNKIRKRKKLSNTYFYKADFFKNLKSKKWKNCFDYVIEHTTLCAIDPKRRKKYIELINHLLKPNGKLVGLFFIRPIKLGGPPFGINTKAVRELFKKDFIEVKKLHYEKCLHKGKLEGDEYLGVFEKKP